MSQNRRKRSRNRNRATTGDVRTQTPQKPPQQKRNEPKIDPVEFWGDPAALPEPIRRTTSLLAVGADRPEAPRRLAQQLGVADRVHVEPGRGDVGALLAASDLLVHPARRELGGLVLLEALVAGLPAVCTAECGFASYTARARAGLVLDAPFRQPSLNDALERLLSAPLDPLREAALAFAAGADLHGMHARIADQIEDAALGRTGR